VSVVCHRLSWPSTWGERCGNESFVSQELHDRRKEGGSLLNLARLRELQGDIPAALELARQAVSALEHTEDAWSIRQAREFTDHLSRRLGTVNPAPT